MVLTELKGLKAKETPCDFFSKPSEIAEILLKGFAATAADSNGAINIWIDDKGMTRCESMSSFIIMDSKKFTKMEFKSVKGWAKKWLSKIK